MSTIPQVNTVLHQWVRICPDCNYHNQLPYQPALWHIGERPPYRPEFDPEKFLCQCGRIQEITPGNMVWVSVADEDDVYVLMPISCLNCQQKQVVHLQARAGFLQVAGQDVRCVKCKQSFWVPVPDRIIRGPFWPSESLMGAYERDIPHEAEFSDLLHALLMKHPEGITVGQLMRRYPDQLKSYSAILPALMLLEKEGKIRLEKSGGHDDPLDVYKAYPIAGK